MLGRTETRTRDRIYCQTMRTVREISRDDRARIATCSLRTPTDRQTDRLKVNYSIDRQLTVSVVVSATAVFKLVDNLMSSRLQSLH